MKTKRIDAYTIVDKKTGEKHLEGFRDGCNIAETIADVIELLGTGEYTVADCVGGYQVRVQREIRGGTSESDRRDKYARQEGFGSWAEMKKEMDEWRNAQKRA